MSVKSVAERRTPGGQQPLCAESGYSPRRHRPALSPPKVLRSAIPRAALAGVASANTRHVGLLAELHVEVERHDDLQRALGDVARRLDADLEEQRHRAETYSKRWVRGFLRVGGRDGAVEVVGRGPRTRAGPAGGTVRRDRAPVAEAAGTSAPPPTWQR
jgi:hypothetical protein